MTLNSIPRLVVAAMAAGAVQFGSRSFPALSCLRSSDVILAVALSVFESDGAKRIMSGLKLRSDAIGVSCAHLISGGALALGIWAARYFNSYYAAIPTIVASAVINLSADLILRKLAPPPGIVKGNVKVQIESHSNK